MREQPIPAPGSSLTGLRPGNARTSAEPSSSNQRVESGGCKDGERACGGSPRYLRAPRRTGRVRSRDHFRASPTWGRRGVLEKTCKCATPSDTTTILANTSFAQRHISIKWRLQPCTLVRNGCANNPYQHRALPRRIYTPEAQPRSRA